MGDAQLANVAPSSLHSKLEPLSDDAKEKLASRSFVRPWGPEFSEVSGAVASMVNVRVAGDGSLLPAVSVARALNVCEPSARLA